MTREHKLALIVGFSLVLVLGVLISDHFSKARQVQMAENIGAATPRQMGAITPGVRLGSEPGSSAPAPIATIDNTAPRRDLQDLPGVIRRDPGVTQIAMGGDRAPAIPLAHYGPDTSKLPYGDHDAGSSSQPGNPIQAPQATPAVPQIPVQRHDIHDGDTLYAIAKKYYGDGNLWQKVREYNKDKVTSAGELREGVTLLIPPKDVLLGKPYVPPTGPSGIAQSSQPTPFRGSIIDPLSKPDPKADPRATASTGNFKDYVVKDGDTIISIARKQLKNGNRWQEIVDANKGTLADPESISVGMKIRIPAK